MTTSRSMDCARRFGAWLMMAATLWLATGCYKATFVNDRVSEGVEHDEWSDFFLFGLIGHEKYDVRKFCSAGEAKVRTGGNFGTGIVSIVTIGIYTPRKIYVWCPHGSGNAAILRVEEVKP